MMVIYLLVKFEFDWTNRFRVTVRKRKMWRDANLIGGLVTRNPPKNSKYIKVYRFYTYVCILFHIFIISLR